MKDQLLQPSERRFAWVIEGQKRGPRSPFDVDLCESSVAAVTPTVGAITPAWVLVVPRRAAFCFADISSTDRQPINGLINGVRREMETFAGESYLFEHGARTVGSKTGCGVDQAHAHLVQLKGNLLRSAIADCSMRWCPIDSKDPWSEIELGREYYLISDFGQSFVAYPEAQRSQYFRRLIARDLLRPEEWDYRLFENEQNARETVRRFGSNVERRAA